MNKVCNNLYIGDYESKENIDDYDEWFVVNLSRSKSDIDSHWIPLKDGIYDGGGNSQQEFAKAVNKVIESINSDKKVLVHCVHGQSRSVSVTSTAIADIKNISYNKSLSQVTSKIGNDKKPADSLNKKGEKYIRHSVDS